MRAAHNISFAGIGEKLTEFIVDHGNAPPAYPEINNATRPLRAAAAARGDTERMSLWAGQGYRLAAERHAGEIIDRLRRKWDLGHSLSEVLSRVRVQVHALADLRGPAGPMTR